MGYGDGSTSGVPPPDSPAGRNFDGFSLSRTDVDERARCVLDAVSLARQRAPRAILEATGHELGALVDGIIPGLLLCLALLTATTLLGAVAGAAIGALAFGVGAAPGAAAGATVGLNAGLFLLEWLGLAFLAGYIVSSVAQATVVAGEGVEIAWRAMDRPRDRSFEIGHAADLLASALGLVFRGVLQGVVAFLLAKGTAAAASRVSELVAHLRASKLGARFAAWVEGNWQALVRNPRLNQSGAKPTAAGEQFGARLPAEASASSAEPASAPLGGSGEKPVPIPRDPHADRLAQRFAELRAQGHGPQRHEGEVSVEQLKRRCLYGEDPVSGTTTDAYTGVTHKYGRHATKITSLEDYVRAEDFVRASSEFKAKSAAAESAGDRFMEVNARLEDVYGPSYRDRVAGKTRIGSKKAPTGAVDTEFADGQIVAWYRKNAAGEWDLITLYPDPQ